MKINRNFLKKSWKVKIKITDIDFDDIKDIRFKIENEFWNEFKNNNNVLSFWFAPKEPLETDRTYVVHYSEAPYYQFGTIHYPAGTTEPKFYRFTLESKSFPDSYKSWSLFIRFNRADLGKTFYLIKSKLEVSDKPSLYSPSKTELEPSEQAVFVAGGGIQGSVSRLRQKGVLYVS